MFAKIKHLIRLSLIWIVPLNLYLTSRRNRKWVKKNKREQDPNLHNLDKRWKFIVKRVKRMNRYLGIKVKILNKENIPNGASWFFPNHTSNFDALYVIEALNNQRPLIPIVRDSLKESKLIKGYVDGTDGYFIKRNDIRDTVKLLNGAALFSKSSQRSVVIFPEGTRSFTTKLLKFKDGAFKFPQKYFIPIVPVTILGTMEARRWWTLKTRVVKFVIHKPLKGTAYLNKPTHLISKLVREEMEKELKRYYEKLTPKEKILHDKLKAKNQKRQIKKDINYHKELGILQQQEKNKKKS